MAEIAPRIEAVAHALLQGAGVGKTAVDLAIPDDVPVIADLEDAARARHQCHLAKLATEGGQEFLRHPGGAQEPLALRAIADDDAGRGRRGHDLVSLRFRSASSQAVRAWKSGTN